MIYFDGNYWFVYVGVFQEKDEMMFNLIRRQQNEEHGVFCVT